MSQREEFEKWASNEGAWPAAIERSRDGYKLAKTQADWNAWKACAEICRCLSPADERLAMELVDEGQRFKEALEDIRDLGAGHPSYIIAMAALNPNFPE